VALGAAPRKTVTRIVGILLVRNEDRFVRRAVENALGFCDEFLLVDNGSTDGTLAILESFSANSPKASLYRISHPRESHDLLKKFIGTRTWVFGVDGDEIYDPAGLEKFRGMVLEGLFDARWMVLGNVIHCEDISNGQAIGYAAPPSRSIVKFYNFAAIDSWEGDTPERLHGGLPVFRAGFSENSKRRLETEYSWAESPFRCLHTCFMKRSSAEDGVDSRENIMETYRGGLTNWMRRTARRLAGRPEKSLWKRERYARGEKVSVDARPFFGEGEC
jgi:glycosyltransferase involved in cell wall biosynthesis